MTTYRGQYEGLTMYYRSGYKYQLAADEPFYTSFRPKKELRVPRITLYPSGLMIVHDGYAWDGASGVVDRDTNIRASCGHDALYQLMRMEKLSHEDWQLADEDFCTWLKEAGAWDITIKIDRLGLKIAGGKYAHPSKRKKIYMV